MIPRFLGIAALALFSQLAAAQSPNQYQEPGITPQRDYLRQTPGGWC